MLFLGGMVPIIYSLVPSSPIRYMFAWGARGLLVHPCTCVTLSVIIFWLLSRRLWAIPGISSRIGRRLCLFPTFVFFFCEASFALLSFSVYGDFLTFFLPNRKFLWVFLAFPLEGTTCKGWGSGLSSVQKQAADSCVSPKNSQVYNNNKSQSIYKR